MCRKVSEEMVNSTPKLILGILSDESPICHTHHCCVKKGTCDIMIKSSCDPHSDNLHETSCEDVMSDDPELSSDPRKWADV